MVIEILEYTSDVNVESTTYKEKITYNCHIIPSLTMFLYGGKIN